MKLSKIFISLFKVALIVALVLAVEYIVYSKISDKQIESVVVTTDIEGVINDIGELATAEYGYKIAQIADKPSKTFAGFKIPFTSSQVIYSYEGLIKAGIDFQDIEVTVNEINKIIYVRIPDVKLLSSEVYFDSLIVYDEEYSPFNTFTFEDMNLSISDLQRQAESSALSSGLLERAATNAQNIIHTSISTYYNLDEYTVEFY